ncbi:MAG: hypothetical protein H8E14_10355 [Candidatus Marinimicrobia bacterium]|nr:hypothetical protein [Candidatus Neomarinimicrobiota bacterium]
MINNSNPVQYRITQILAGIMAITIGICIYSCAGVSNTTVNSKVDKMINTRFIEFEKRLDSLIGPAERQIAVDELIADVKTCGGPIIEDDSTVVFLYQGDDDTVSITGDMNEWVNSIPMEKISGTNLFFLRLKIEPDARIEYWLLPQSETFFATDKFNLFQVWNGFGPVSELAMPGYQRHPYFDDFKYGKKWNPATLDMFEMPTGVLDYSRQIHVYLPPGYEEDSGDYPSLYVQDGLDYVEFAIVPGILDRLIADKLIEPLVAVFVTPPNRHLPEMPNRMTEYGLNDDYVSFMCEELVPEISQRYRTEDKATSRLVVGDSYGGLISVYAGFKRPDIFGLVYGQSGYYSFQEDTLIKQIAQADTQPVRYYIDVGEYEHQVGADLLPAGETDFLAANRRLKIILKDKGYDFIYREYPEGHTWGNWRRHLIDVLIHFFGTGE